MKTRIFLLLLGLILPVACGGTDTVVESSPTTPALPADTAVPTPTDVPEPTDTPAPVLLTSADEMAGVWLGTVAGERGYVMYTHDGRFMVALAQDDLTIAPRVSGEYWFEDGHIYLRDLENAGHWTDCDADTVGVYDVLLLEEGRVQFQTVVDDCNEGGFTRNYLFANMTQEWLAEPEAVPAPESDAAALPELATALQTIADTWVNENGAPGVILLVDAPEMGFTWQGAAGMAMPEEAVAMAPDDQFIISSMTKMVTAVTAMKLVEEGKLALADPISQYLPAEMTADLLVLNGESLGAAITVRQLLSHTSGLGDFSNGPDTDGSGLPDFKDLVLAEPDTVWDEQMVLAWAVANVEPVAQPGEMYHYSDTNYQLMGMIIEAASGMALHEAYRQIVFTPLGMDHTYFEFREEPAVGVNGRRLTHAYYNGTLWNTLDSHSYEWGSGGLVSTAVDMNRFLRAWADGSLFADPATKETMTSWVETTDGGVYYGLGFMRFALDEWDIPGLGEVQGHGGLFNSQAFYWPEQNVTIVSTLNSNQPSLGFIGMMIEVMSTVQAFTEN